MGFFQKLERKFGRYAIRGLTKYIIAAYVIGYVIYIMSSAGSTDYQLLLSLNPGAIMRGQVWRLFTWVLMPPSSLSVFTLVMLFCYYQLGSVLERVWGDFMYNFYIFFGLIMTVVGAFIMYYCGGSTWQLYIELTGGSFFTTYYVSLSIFLGFAMTFPDQQMLLFFIIPIKIKYIAIFDVAYLTYCLIIGGWGTRVQVLSSLAAVIIFFIMTRRYSFKNARAGAQQRKRSREFKQAMGRGRSAAGAAVRHKCHICGQTEAGNPDLEFRYCSKCNGNYEYCQNHLFTHTHIQ